MSNFNVHIGGQFLHEEALSRTRFAENEDHASLDDDWQVAVFHSVVNCCNLRCLASPCRTISQGISLSNCTAKTSQGSARRDQARRLAPHVHVASARLRASQQCASVLPGASASKKATGEPPLLGCGRGLIHCPKLISCSQLGTTIDRQPFRVLCQLWAASAIP